MSTITVKPEQFEILDDQSRMVSGWASIQILDKQNDIVPIAELQKGMLTLMDRGANIIYGHSNKPVGKVLQWEVKEHPVAKTKGIHLICKFFTDYPVDDIVWDKVKKGELTGFSIGATAREEVKTVKDGVTGAPKDVGVLHDISLMEISVVEKPANQLALIDEINYFAKSDVSVDKVNFDTISGSKGNIKPAGEVDVKKPKKKSLEQETFEKNNEDFSKSWKKEKKEHPWATAAQARRIEADHKRADTKKAEFDMLNKSFVMVMKTKKIKSLKDMRKTKKEDDEKKPDKEPDEDKEPKCSKCGKPVSECECKEKSDVRKDLRCPRCGKMIPEARYNEHLVECQGTQEKKSADMIEAVAKCSKKVKRCVSDVKAKGEKVNPYAVCHASIGKAQKVIAKMYVEKVKVKLRKPDEKAGLDNKQLATFVGYSKATESIETINNLDDPSLLRREVKDDDKLLKLSEDNIAMMETVKKAKKYKPTIDEAVSALNNLGNNAGATMRHSVDSKWRERNKDLMDSVKGIPNRRNTGSRKFRCDECSSKMNTRQELINHQMNAYGHDRPIGVKPVPMGKPQSAYDANATTSKKPIVSYKKPKP